MAPGSKTSDAPFGNRQSSVKAPSERVYAQKVLRLWLCGRLAGELDGEPVSMPSSGRARALIGWLALHPGPHPRADVATRLWPETSEARANLRTAIWAVRQAWGAAGIHLDGQRNLIGLMPAEVGWMRSRIRRSVSHCLKANCSPSWMMTGSTLSGNITGGAN